MEIASIMQRLEASNAADSSGIKTAAATPTTTPTADALRSELRQALSVVTEKTAAAPAASPQASPTSDLLKIASEMAGAEEEALMKQAQVYGAAICDGFMTRYAQYEQAASEVAPMQQPTKTAAVAPVQSLDFNKFASENPQLVKEAYDLGYHQKMAALKEAANERFGAGYNDTMGEVHKIASDLYKHGAEWAQWAVKTAEYNAQRA